MSALMILRRPSRAELFRSLRAGGAPIAQAFWQLVRQDFYRRLACALRVRRILARSA